MNTKKAEKIIRSFEDDRFELVEVPSGQVIFPIYGASNGLSTLYICYFHDRLVEWPKDGDFGRQGRTPQGIIAIEFEVSDSGQIIENKLHKMFGTMCLQKSDVQVSPIEEVGE